MDSSVILTAFGMVFIAEIIGDKSIYTIGSLVTRFSTPAVFIGLSTAFCLKMLAAVMVGQLLTELPASLLGAISAATFLLTAFIIWRKKPVIDAPRDSSTGFSGSTAISFASIFFTEWGDIGQLSAAALTVQYKAPAAVWLGASLALILKGILAISLGLALRRYFAKSFLHYAAVGLCLLMSVLAVWQAIFPQ